MYSNNRDAYRQAFFTVWQKYQKKLLLEPVEAQLAEIIALHPEYHALLEKPESYQQQEFTLEENPFLHMSLHISLREQIGMDRPKGIVKIHQDLCAIHQDAHAVEHSMIECLARILWQAQQSGEAPQEKDYLDLLSRLA